jgi:hypothetical protein
VVTVRTFLSLAWLPVLAAACATAPPSTPTPDLAAAARETEAVHAQATVDTQATQDQGTRAAVEATQIHRTSSAATRIASATAQARPMADLVQDLYAQGYIDRADGTFFSLADFAESWALINWYQYYPSDYSPVDFVIRADAAWESASDHANWDYSGCGFVFRETGDSNHYHAYLGLDGWVYMERYVTGEYASLGGSYYGDVDVPSGAAKIMLLADGTTFMFFVNGERVHVRTDTQHTEGFLSYAVSSGTNTDYGTRCEMTHVELWELK